MPISISNESKNNLSITNETKGNVDLTIDEASGTIDGAAGTIDNPRTALVKESKNSLSITNESKNVVIPESKFGTATFGRSIFGVDSPTYTVLLNESKNSLYISI